MIRHARLTPNAQIMEYETQPHELCGLGQQGTPGLRYLDRFGATVAW